MVQLKTVSLRLKSITNIQKITKTMKMVSASKFTRAERELAAARPFGYGPRKFYQSARLPGGEEGAAPPAPGDKAVKAAPAEPVPPADPEDLKKLKRVYIAMTSDRGLCGGVHSGVVRRIRRELATRAGAAKDGAAGASAAAASGSRIVAVGDKARGMLWRQLPEHMLLSVKDIGRTAPVFADASRLAAALSTAGYRFDVAEIYYNKYFTPVKYELTVIPVFSLHRIEAAPNMSAFDDVDSDQLEMYAEWTTVALLYYALKQGAAAEQSARMAAMDNATKNAGDMIRKLTLLFNRTRQAVITRELIEIISGAAALN